MKTELKNKPLLYTIGHSTRSLEELAVILESFHIKKLIDVRTIPQSRFNPQSNKQALARRLPLRGIEYHYMPGLGGLRHPLKDSINTGWRNSSFRGYADYMQTHEFKENLNELIKHGQEKPVVIMCAEAVPWRCHRSLIADALLVNGFEVINIMGLNKGTFHILNPMVNVNKNKIHYPPRKEDIGSETKS